MVGNAVQREVSERVGGICPPAAAAGNQSGVKGEQVQGGDSLYAPISWQMAAESFAPEQKCGRWSRLEERGAQAPPAHSHR